MFFVPFFIHPFNKLFHHKVRSSSPQRMRREFAAHAENLFICS